MATSRVSIHEDKGIFSEGGRIPITIGATEVAAFESDGTATGWFGSIADVTLAADAASISLTGLNLSSYVRVSMVAILRTSGAGATGSSGLWERAMMRFNDDATANNYTWEVVNSDATHVSNADVGYAAGIEAGHMTANASPANTWGQNLYHFILPASGHTKMVLIQAGTVLAGFTGVKSALGTTGAGYWNNTAAITKITILANEGGNLLAGSRLLLFV